MKNVHLYLYFDRTMLYSNFHFVFHMQSILIIVIIKIVTERCEYCFSIQEYCVVVITENLCFHVSGRSFELPSSVHA